MLRTWLHTGHVSDDYLQRVLSSLNCPGQPRPGPSIPSAPLRAGFVDGLGNTDASGSAVPPTAIFPTAVFTERWRRSASNRGVEMDNIAWKCEEKNGNGKRKKPPPKKKTKKKKKKTPRLPGQKCTHIHVCISYRWPATYSTSQLRISFSPRKNLPCMPNKRKTAHRTGARFSGSHTPRTAVYPSIGTNPTACLSSPRLRFLSISDSVAVTAGADAALGVAM